MTTPTPRKPRCRVLTIFGDRCQNEALSTEGFCAKHLAIAAEEFRRLTTRQAAGDH